MIRVLLITAILFLTVWLFGQKKTYTVTWRMREVVPCDDSTCVEGQYVMRDMGVYRKTFTRLDSAKRFYKLAVKEERKTVLMINVKLE